MREVVGGVGARNGGGSPLAPAPACRQRSSFLSPDRRKLYLQARHQDVINIINCQQASDRVDDTFGRILLIYGLKVLCLIRQSILPIILVGLYNFCYVIFNEILNIYFTIK